MSYILRFFSGAFKFLAKYKMVIPGSSVGIYVVIQFIYDLINHGFSYSIAHLSQTLLAAELTINRNVHLALQHSPDYNLGAFFQIVFAVIILWMFIKWMTKLFVKIAGAQAEWGAMVMALFFIAAIEVATVKVIDGVWGFVPIKDGIWFLLVNLGPVFSNMHWFWQNNV